MFLDSFLCVVFLSISRLSNFFKCNLVQQLPPAGVQINSHTRTRLQRDVNANAPQSCCRWCVYATPKGIRPVTLLPFAPLHNNGSGRALSVTINCPVDLYLSISWPFPPPAGESFVRRPNNKWQDGQRAALLPWFSRVLRVHCPSISFPPLNPVLHVCVNPFRTVCSLCEFI